MKVLSLHRLSPNILYKSTIYTFIALAPKAPNMAEATAITTFKILSQTFFFHSFNLSKLVNTSYPNGFSPWSPSEPPPELPPSPASVRPLAPTSSARSETSIASPPRAKLAAYAGIDPTMRQSGEYNGVRNRMSKRGSPYLRHAIWLAASSAVLHDPALKLYFQKKRDEGKPYMASVGHACRKMVSIIYAVMRDNKAYTPYIPNEISA